MKTGEQRSKLNKIEVKNQVTQASNIEPLYFVIASQSVENILHQRNYLDYGYEI